jgi:uncharacterized repeat protein (TIGR01451 family)
MKIIVKIALSLALAFPSLVPAHAQETGNPIVLSGDVKAVKITTDAEGNAKTELVEPIAIVPGDRLVFGTDFANKGNEPVTNFVVTNPLPAAVRLAPDADQALEVSVDGGKSFGTLPSLTLANPDGTSRAAAHADVTHIRWVLASIAPGASGRLTYPAIIR